MNQNKKIVLLTPGFSADENDFACTTYLQNLVLSYKQFFPSATIQVVTSQYPHQEREYLWNGIKVYSAGGANGRYFSRWRTWRKVWKKLRQIHREESIDVIHSFWFTECALIAQKFCAGRKIKHIASILGQEMIKSNKYLKLIRTEQSEVVVISKFLADRYFMLTGKRADKIIPFGINTLNLRRPLLAEINFDVIGVGSFTKLKNYSLFVDIISEMVKTFPTIKSVIVGKGEQFEMLKRKILDLNLSINIELLEEMPNEKIFELMCRSKFFLHTSSYEGQSLVMSEALYAGLPIVCFDTGRPYDGDRMNICNNKEEMLDAVRKLLNENNKFDPVLLQTTKQTANEYFELY